MLCLFPGGGVHQERCAEAAAEQAQPRPRGEDCVQAGSGMEPLLGKIGFDLFSY